MKYNFATKRVLNFEYQRNLLLGLSSVLLLIIVIMSACLFFRSERVIVLPPEVRREFWAEGNRFSPEYLEEQAIYMLHLALDVNKENLPYNTEILMRYADTETCASLRNRFEKDIKKLKKNEASTRFDVKEVKVYPDSNTVHVTGRLNSFVGSKLLGDKRKVYEVKFKTFRGRLFLQDIKKVEETKEEEE